MSKEASLGRVSGYLHNIFVFPEDLNELQPSRDKIGCSIVFLGKNMLIYIWLKPLIYK